MQVFMFREEDAPLEILDRDFSKDIAVLINSIKGLGYSPGVRSSVEHPGIPRAITVSSKVAGPDEIRERVYALMKEQIPMLHYVLVPENELQAHKKLGL